MAEKKYTGFYLAERHFRKPQAEQISAQIIEVYSFENQFWHSPDKEHLIPAGRRQRLLTIDLGTLLPGISESLNARERHKQHKKYPREENIAGSRKLRLPDSLHHLEHYTISSFEVHEDDVYYYFMLRPEAITLELPLEIYITEYLMENKELLSFNREKIQVWTKKWKNSPFPQPDDFELRHFDTSLPLYKSNSSPKKS
ncbi:MAG TPA: hypothetical protein VJB13_02170 [Candidatus Nanoarchaeia archaeon]|nr:hypothetical protein [Candidatus Nanoarchaeia archaeon]